MEESLRRLQIDYIDLYYTRKDDGITPVEETLDAHDQLVPEGKVRHIGASNLRPENLTASLAYAAQTGPAAYEVYQPHYNLLARREFESRYAPIVAAHRLTDAPFIRLAPDEVAALDAASAWQQAYFVERQDYTKKAASLKAAFSG